MKNELIKLKRYRLYKGFTREKLAEELGISKFTLRSYEQGTRNIKTETLKKIAKILGCTVDELI